MPRRLCTAFVLACVSILCGATAAHAATLTLAWNPDDATTTGYILSYGTQSGVYTLHIDVGNQTQYAVSGLADSTTYYFVVQAYNAAGTSDPSSEVMGQTSAPSITSINFAPDRSAPQPPNTTITWTASPSGGVPPYSFKWWVFDGQVWTAVSGWTATNTYAWVPSLPNANYRVGVWAKSAGNPADAPEMPASAAFPIQASGHVTGVNLTPNVSAPQPPGTTVTFTANASGGTPPYSFKWWVFDGQAWSTLTPWTSMNTLAWTPMGPNPNYLVGVWVKSAGNPADAAEFPASVAFPIQGTSGHVVSVTLTPNLSAPRSVGTTITWTAVPAGGSPPYSFKWWVSDGQAWTMVRDWNTSNTYAWTPMVANPGYLVGVWVKSAGNPADAPELPVSQAFPIQHVTSVSLTPDHSAPQPAGTTITWTAGASGGTAPYSFKWWVFDGQVWTLLRDWNSSNTYAWTPLIANPNYRIGVWVRSSGDTIDASELPFSVAFPIH